MSAVEPLFDCRRRVMVASLILFGLSLPLPVLGRVELTVSRAGFPVLSGRSVVRSGQWAPVVVDLALIDEETFDGRLRLGQIDMDGDVAFDHVEAHLNAETGGQQRLVLYTLPNLLRQTHPFSVELQTVAGETVEVLYQGTVTRRAVVSPPPEIISDDTVLILSLSKDPVGRLRDLVAADAKTNWLRPIEVAHLSPKDVPEHWVGLEAVDFIQWEGASPADLTARQVSSLLDWVRHGGTLLIMAAPADAAFSLNKSLDAVLPVKIGDITAVYALDRTYARLMKGDDDSTQHGGYREPASAVQCARREGSTVIVREDSFASDIVAERRHGRGKIIFVGMTERDLFRGVGNAIVFYRKLFGLALAEREEQAAATPVSLFGQVAAAISFARSGGVFVLIASFFSAAYVLVATLGTWWFLGLRGWRHHSWTAFAGIGVAASVLSVASVNTVRGIGDELHQLSIIDMEAGSSLGHATTLFGLRTVTDKRLDLWLPADPVRAQDPTFTACALRPLPVGSFMSEAPSSYADPTDYGVRPTVAALDGVRLRATLKQLEGRWQGNVGGSLTGKITLPSGHLMSEDSHVINKLGVDLVGCVLLHTFADFVTPEDRPGGIETAYPRNRQSYAFFLGDIPSDGQPHALAERCYAPVSPGRAFQRGTDRLLTAAQREWSSSLRGLLNTFDFGGESSFTYEFGDEKFALFLLSTVGDFDAVDAGGIVERAFGLRTWSRDRMRHLDLRNQLDRGTAVLIGFAKSPGPVRLFRRQGSRPYSAIEPNPDHSWCMYRIRIPVTVIGTPEADPDAEKKRF